MDQSTFYGFFTTLLGGDKAAMLKLYEWMEGMLLTPEVKSDKAIVLVGPPGCGKSAVIEVLRRMLGDGAVLQTTAPQSDVWGRFNGPMENALVVCIDEVTSRGSHSWQGELKALIADSHILVNERYQQIQCHPPSGDAEAHFKAFYAMLNEASPHDLRQAVLSYAMRLQ